jgi:hypothetical protein
MKLITKNGQKFLFSEQLHEDGETVTVGKTIIKILNMAQRHSNWGGWLYRYTKI